MAEVGGGQPWEQLKLTWETRRNAPCEMWRGAGVAHGSVAYFRTSGSHDVFVYNPEKDDWSKLPECPQRGFGLAVINNILTVVGGKVHGQYTNRLSSFRGAKWVTVFPPMPTKRHYPAVISAQNYLIAVGGIGVGGDLSTVEVMDVDTLEWYSAASQTEPVYNMSATVCGGRLYLLGGFDKFGERTHAVFTCTLDSLICSCHPPSQTPPHTSEASVWQRVADVPVIFSTCTTLNGRVIAVGGRDSDGCPTPAVHMYNPESDLWLRLGNMATARYDCLVVGLRDCVIAVGGYTRSDFRGKCATVEVGYLQLSEMDVSGVDDSPLGEQDLLDIQSTTIEVAARWKHFGDMFRLSPGTLNTIGINHSDTEACLREMILRWLRKSGYDHQLYGPPTWRWVVEAVASPAGGDNPELARRIADQHSNALPSPPPPSSTAATGSGTARPRIEVEVVEEEHLVFSRNEECTFDRRKGQGFVLHVPKGAVLSSDCTVEVKSHIVSQSTPQFIFPEGSKLVSGVYRITASRELSKPVTLEIQHCSTIKGDPQHTQLEVATADSTTGPPYHFKPYKGEYVRVFDSYVEVKLVHFSFWGSFSRAIKKPASIRYCGLVCCLKSSELTRSWEYHIVLIRNLQLCIAAIKKEYATSEGVQELNVEFEGDALTLDNVSVDGTTTSGGWHVATKWDPARVKKVEADNYTPGRSIPQCCVLASCTGEATTVGALRHVLKFSGTQTPKSYLLCRDAQSERSTSVSSVDGPSTPTPVIDVSGVDDSPLGEQNLYDIQSTTTEVAARWKHIGDAFRLSDGTLEMIRADFLDSEACLREVISKWLRKSGYDHRLYGPPTWRWVVEAVGSPAGGNNPELARRIADQHPKGPPGLQSGMTQTPTATPTDITLLSPSSPRDSSFTAKQSIIPKDKDESKEESCCCVVF